MENPSMKMTTRPHAKFGKLLGLALLAAALWALPARADTISVFADLPLDFSLTVDGGQGKSDTSSASNLSGYKVGFTLPIFVGLAYESYGGQFNSANVVGQSFNYDVTMVDVFFNLPLPKVNIALGVGAGTGKFSKGPAGVTVNDAILTQTFASLGINVAPLVDLHVGYHMLSGTNDFANAPGVPSLKVAGTMTSLGIKLGF
jgi:hypothetical protein